MSAVELEVHDSELVSPKGAAPLCELPRALAERIAGAHGLSVADVCGASRFAAVVTARRELARVLRAAPYLWSLTHIGRFLGARDHTTILKLLRPVTCTVCGGHDHGTYGHRDKPLPVAHAAE